MGNIEEKDLPYIIDNMQNILNNMQRNISNFNQQKTKLYWSQVKMSNNIKFWHKDVEAIKHLNNLLDNMLIYTEKIMILVENILNDVKKLKQDMDNGNIKNQEINIYIIEQKVYILSMFYKNYKQEQDNYIKYIEAVKQLLNRHKAEIQDVSICQKIKCKFM